MTIQRWLGLLAGLTILTASCGLAAPGPTSEAAGPSVVGGAGAAGEPKIQMPAVAADVLPPIAPAAAQELEAGTSAGDTTDGAPPSGGSGAGAERPAALVERIVEETLPAPAPPDQATGGDPSVAAGGPSEEPCDIPPAPPLPPPGSGPGRWSGFRDPLPATPLWNPPGRKRVGLQAGHWLAEQAPEELRRLQHGANGGGKQEWEVNLDIAQRTKALLEAVGVHVDLLPATVPMRYRAHAFVSIHADGDPAGRARGFKIARPGFSSVPPDDDRLVEALYAAYGPATGLPRDDEHITLRMRYYYAFNSRRYCHAVAPGVPQAIVETGFLTSAADRVLLLGDPEAAARGLAAGILAFLNETPPPAPR